MQRTINKIISFSGVGLHTGCNANVRILPAAEGGITFLRKDIGGSPLVKADASNVVATSYATTLGVKGVTVSTVEHLLAAFYGLGIDSAVVEIDGPEVPILDGSSALFVELIEAAGVLELSCPKKHLVVKQPIKVSDGEKYVLILPAEDVELTIDYSIDFSHPFLSKQTFCGLFSTEVFRNEVGSARTFGFLRDVETLRANGLAKGGSLNNAVVIGDTDIINEGGLRYPDEFVRHKVLDMMGDLSLLGAPIAGHLIAHRSGHAMNFKLVQQILKNPGKWELRDSSSKEAPVKFRRSFSEKVAAI